MHAVSFCHLHVGEEVERGQRYGFIRFGSRVDIYVPLNSEVLVFVGQKVRATDTVIALLNPEKLEEPVQGQPVPELEASEKLKSRLLSRFKQLKTGGINAHTKR